MPSYPSVRWEDLFSRHLILEGQFTCLENVANKIGWKHLFSRYRDKNGKVIPETSVWVELSERGKVLLDPKGEFGRVGVNLKTDGLIERVVGADMQGFCYLDSIPEDVNRVFSAPAFPSHRR